MEEVTVKLGPASYTITIGPGVLLRLGEIVAKSSTRKVLVITDNTVGQLYSEQVLAFLQDTGIAVHLATIEQGEASKSFAIAEQLITKAIESGLDRHSLIIALGGGVVGDLAGFVAATYLRGIPFIQVPTSLLAQVDSSVGGKVAINHRLGKNMIGAFYQPQAVLIDTDTLQSLPDRELSTGLAELIKHGLIADRTLFEDLLRNSEQVLARETVLLTSLISRSCRIKAAVVEQDEREAGLRIILNFGHTIGHAVEAASGFSYTHGEAVAIGIHGAALISKSLGLCGIDVVNSIRQILTAYHLPLTAPGLKVDELTSWLIRDKKSIGGHIHWVLLTDIGQSVVRNNVPDHVVRQALEQVTIDQL